MKISRYKLNAILKSGINPDIKTRKQLAVILGVDHTSITRWFATRDRLGNPRFPVVPDRHVATILQLFSLAPNSLELDDEGFRRHCFELALRRAESARKEAGQTKPSRAEKIAQRQLRIPPHRNRNIARFFTVSVTAFIVAVSGWQLFIYFDKQTLQVPPDFYAEANCWQGYSPQLGDFTYWDESDPCHYRKLLSQALQDLEASNSGDDNSNTQDSHRAVDDYIIFLSDQLDQRRVKDRAKLHYELGRRQLSQFDFGNAQAAFMQASEQLSYLENLDTELGTNIMRNLCIASYADKPWRYARENYEAQLLTDPLWNKYWLNAAETALQENPERVLAISELENGNLQRAEELIDEAIAKDSLLLGGKHFFLASDYLVKSQILSRQNKLKEARAFANEAKRLDEDLLGANHPRVIQDQMVLVLIALTEEDFNRAISDYRPIADFLNIFAETEFPASQMDHWLQTGMAELLATIKESDQESSQAAWRSVHNAFVSDNPYLPRQFAAVLLSDKLESSR